MQLLERMGWNKAVEFITFYDWIIEQNKTIEDLRDEVNRQNETYKEESVDEFGEYIKKRRKLKDEGINTDWCEKCDMPLLAIESPTEDCEAELVCTKCKKSECIELSLADYHMKLNNEMNPDERNRIEPGEDRIEYEARKKRREICHSCEHLNGRFCKRCGCSVKHRTYYKILDCPDKRW